VLAPALSIIGMSTPRELWKACKSRDIGNGFLNGFLFIEEKAHPQYQRVSEDMLNVPKELKVALSRLYQPAAASNAQPIGGEEYRPAFRMSWGPGAEEVYEWGLNRNQMIAREDCFGVRLRKQLRLGLALLRAVSPRR
jgi:hypothetical protein